MQTVENFLFHFYSFKDVSKKEFIYNNIKTYLILISEIDHKMDQKESMELFDKYLYPVGHLYVVYKRFSFYPKLDVLFYFLTPICLLMFLLGLSVYWYAVLAFVFLFYISYILWKMKMRKIFGLYF